MYATHFDRLVQAFAASGSRRGLLRLLAILPLPGVLAAFLAHESKAATRRRRTPQHHRAAGRDPLQEQAKRKKKKCAKAGQTTAKKRKKCCAGLVKDGTGRCAAPPSGCIPATCAPTACGSVPDGCGGTLSCGGCVGNSLCLDGVCQQCNVCPNGSFFSSVQAAINAAAPAETLRLCAGLYSGDIVIGKSLTLIGAGNGTGAGATILQGSGTDRVVRIEAGTTVSLQSLRITGGQPSSPAAASAATAR